MNCEEYKHRLHDYFIDRLTPAETKRVDAHAAGCDDCGALMRLARELTCRELTELLNDYVDETLPRERREVLDRHLSICADCVAYLESYRSTIRMSAVAMKRSLRRAADEMPEALIDAILAARLEEERKRARS